MLRAWLTAVGLDVVVVDLGSPVIEQAGVQRLQVQLLASSHDQGRPWDGDPIELIRVAAVASDQPIRSCLV